MLTHDCGSPLEATLSVPVLAGTGNVGVSASWTRIGVVQAGLWWLTWQVYAELTLHGVDVAFIEEPSPRAPFAGEGNNPMLMEPYFFTGLHTGHVLVRGPARIYLRQTPTNYYLSPRRDMKAALFYSVKEPGSAPVQSSQRCLSVVHQLRSNGSWFPLAIPTPEPVLWRPERVSLSSGYWQGAISPDTLYIHRLDVAGFTLTDIATIQARNPLVWSLETWTPQSNFNPLGVSFVGGENRGPEQLIFVWEKP